MNTYTIAPENWVEFFNRFSRDHYGWLATIEVLDRQAGPQNLAENLPFEGISLDVKGTRPSSIDVSVGDWSRRHVNHIIDTPLQVCEAEAADGDVDLQLEPAVGPVTLIHLHAPM